MKKNNQQKRKNLEKNEKVKAALSLQFQKSALKWHVSKHSTGADPLPLFLYLSLPKNNMLTS